MEKLIDVKELIKLWEQVDMKEIAAAWDTTGALYAADRYQK
jgi:hypothetical protein